MFKNIFLASYPKSGNTWLRSIILSSLQQNNIINIKDLSKIRLLSDKMNFTSFKNKIYDKKGLIDYDWMSKNLILCQKKLNEKTKYNFFFKTHSVRHKSFTNKTEAFRSIFSDIFDKKMKINCEKISHLPTNSVVSITMLGDWRRETLLKSLNGAVLVQQDHANILQYIAKAYTG